ncbi:MAG: hypothetical protein FD121_1084 [Gallionellaceae bacterium]|nr:MAG: hypothetical protein FD121_1084 [Gallionellaceae bacterium]
MCAIRWMKETHKFKEQVINSLRISHGLGREGPDLYEVDAATLKQVSEPH